MSNLLRHLSWAEALAVVIGGVAFIGLFEWVKHHALAEAVILFLAFALLRFMAAMVRR